MPRYNPRTHVFGYGGTTPKEERERYALEEFCKYMRHHHRASYGVFHLADALRQGLVIKVKGEPLDGVLRTSRGPVAVELLGYSPLDDRGDVMARDRSLRQRVKPALYDVLDAKHYSLTLWYREVRRTKSRGTVQSVPMPGEWRALTKELASVLTAAPPLDFNTFLAIRFVAEPGLARQFGMHRTLYLEAVQFPVCAAHLNQVRLQGLGEGLTPQVESNLKVGHIGLDGPWVREQLTIKARKSGDSRLRANGLPLWLIVHSDGHAIHQTIHETHRARAVEVCREVLVEAEHEFDRAYWADRTGFVDAAWVGRAI